MKTTKYIVAAFLFSLSATASLQAQDTIMNRSVSVEREYRPVIQDAGKINSMPRVLELNVQKTPAKYNDFNLPLDVGFNIHTLAAADLAPIVRNNNEGYARVGLGSYSNTLLDFAYPLISQPDMRLDFSFNHLGTFESKRLHSTTNAALAFDKLFSTFDLYAGIGGGHEHFKYYGDNFNRAGVVGLDTLAAKHGSSIYTEKDRAGAFTSSRIFSVNDLAGYPNSDTFWRFNMHAGVRSLPLSTDLHYLAEMQYNVFSAVNGLHEDMVHTKVKFNSPNEENRMGVDFELYNMMYSSTAIPTFNFWKNYSVLMLNPYYSIDRTEWNVRLGFKTSMSFVHGKKMNPSPDVRGEWRIDPKVLSLYGGFTGDFEVNSLDKIFSENPFLFSDLRVNDTYTPYNLYVGIKLKPVYNLLLDAYVDFRQIDNQYFYVNREYKLTSAVTPMAVADSSFYSNRFNVIYSGASVTKLGIRANYNLQSFLNVELKYAVNNWSVDTQQYAWNKPKYEAEWNTNVRINHDITLSTNMFYQGGRYARLGNTAVAMKDKVDVNLGVSYTYLNWFTAFAKINNLINSKYQDFYGYDVQGMNMMVGAAFSF